jgi:hypothetical protein
MLSAAKRREFSTPPTRSPADIAEDQTVEDRAWREGTQRAAPAGSGAVCGRNRIVGCIGNVSDCRNRSSSSRKTDGSASRRRSWSGSSRSSRYPRPGSSIRPADRTLSRLTIAPCANVGDPVFWAGSCGSGRETPSFGRRRGCGKRFFRLPLNGSRQLATLPVSAPRPWQASCTTAARGTERGGDESSAIICRTRRNKGEATRRNSCSCGRPS